LDPQPTSAPNKKDNNGRWHDKNGKFVSQAWPPNDGFGSIKGEVIRGKTLLRPGHELDRFGGWTDADGKFRDLGSYFSDSGVPFSNRALPPEVLNSPYKRYKVVKPIEVDAGPIAPWFGEPGGATQYLVPRIEGGVEGLIKAGKIIQIE
jgi:hypothetical protein